MMKRSPIAVVGMAGIFPGAPDLPTYWHNIVSKFDANREVSPDRWVADAERMVNRTPAQDRAFHRRGCFVDPVAFDPTGFDLPPDLLQDLDPMVHLVLSVGRTAVSDPVPIRFNRKRTGVVLAAIALPTDAASALSRNLIRSLIEQQLFGSATYRPPTEAQQLASRVTALPATMLARCLGLGGGAFTLDAACASSLYAVKLACDELAARRADAMLAGGVSRPDCLYTQVGFSQLRALSAAGRCAPFDRSADGLVVGEGAGILVLKRLEDALAANDRIYGLIRGIGLSNDMRGNLLAPDSEGQLRAMRTAYASVGWSPDTVDLIECHGAGTPLGDATELRSLRTLWESAGGPAGRCAIGSVKSMIGHLLTAAGAAGMIKTLLALDEKILPPSLNFDHPPDDSPLVGSPFRVQTSAEPWPDRADGCPRRAAVSAFGFGGINGHVLLEEWPPLRPAAARNRLLTLTGVDDGRHFPSAAGPETTEPVAVVGMSVAFGPITSLREFQETVFNGRSIVADRPPDRWKGCDGMLERNGVQLPRKGGFMRRLPIGISEFRIPPKEIPGILPQHLLMLKVAAAAMTDAGLTKKSERPRMGVVIGLDFDYEATNFNPRWSLYDQVRQWRMQYFPELDDKTVEAWCTALQKITAPPLTASRTLGALGGIVASRVAREFRCGGPSFSVSAEAASGNRALEIGVRFLQQQEADAVLVGAVDFAADIRQILAGSNAAEFSQNGAIRPFDRGADGTLPGEGAAAVVLKRLDQALAEKDRIYAVVTGIGNAGGRPGDAAETETYAQALRQALQDADLSVSQIDFVETLGCGIPARDRSEIQALQAVFSDRTTPCALGATLPNLGHTGAAAGLASIVKTALCLYQEVIPPLTHYRMPAEDILRRNIFHVPTAPQYWLRDRSAGPRRACAGLATGGGNSCAVVLEEASPRLVSGGPAFSNERRFPLGPAPCSLFVIEGHDRESLRRELERLARHAARQDGRHESLDTVARSWHHRHPPDRSKTQAVAVLTENLASLAHWTAEARAAVATGTAHRFGADDGLCYTPSPAGPGELAFVYPGYGSHYIGMGREVGLHWPEVLRRMDAGTARLKSQCRPEVFLPQRASWEPGWEEDAGAWLDTDPLNPIFGQVVFGGMMTELMHHFNVTPQAVIGYSLGESTALFAMKVWPDRDQMLDRMLGSDLFKTGLAGPCLALRRAWGLRPEDVFEWRVSVLNRPADAVRTHLQNFPQARLLIVNTPEECVVGGNREQVDALIGQLGCQAVDLKNSLTVHCDALAPVAEAYKSLHDFPTTPVPGVRFYSCAAGRAYAPTRKSTAAAILDQALNGFDFPRTVEQAHADGVRVFLELGPGATCSRMVGRILGGRPHLAVSADASGMGGVGAVLKCLGTLIANRVPVELENLYPAADQQVTLSSDTEPAPSQTIQISIGGRVPAFVGPFNDDAVQTAPPATEAPPTPVAVDVPSRATVAAARSQAPGHQPTSLQTEESDSTAHRPTADIDEPVQPLRKKPVLPNPPAPQSQLIEAFNVSAAATAAAHSRFLDFSNELNQAYGENAASQIRLMEALVRGDSSGHRSRPAFPSPPPAGTRSDAIAFTRDQCLEFATGRVANVLGPDFAAVDTYPTRVRLPGEPLMLVDRIVSIEGKPCSLTAGHLVTEHDVRPGAWYLDGGRAPVCIAVEAGQADLFLCAYLGIDKAVKGRRVYRLLDAGVVFHRDLPLPGETIRYRIEIEKFIRQGETWLFFFGFEGTIDNQPLISMTGGCAGFFTPEEIENSGGIVRTAEDRTPQSGRLDPRWTELVPQAPASFDEAALEALRAGDLGAGFGPDFEGVSLTPALRLPGGRMKLIDRVDRLEPRGGRFGLGSIQAAADIHPDDWFLTCHFVDDMTMPGTLMYECCAHALRVFLQRLGWVTDRSGVHYAPVAGIKSVLQCRGPVTPQTRRVIYEVEIKELGYVPEPYAIADAHMVADGRTIVRFTDLSLRMAGLNRESIEALWRKRRLSAAETENHRSPPVVFDRRRLLTFATGNPSEAFGKPYEEFDTNRFLARLPAPPYAFIDRVVKAEPQAWELKPGGWVETEVDIDPAAWYFRANRSDRMPYCVLLEIALQTCGWLAAYAGSALHSRKDLHFRNLDGQANLHQDILCVPQTLRGRCRMTKVSVSGDIIIEAFEFKVLRRTDLVYEGTTVFGFFTTESLANQKGIQRLDDESAATTSGGRTAFEPVTLGDEAPLTPEDPHLSTVTDLTLPAKALRMIDRIETCQPHGGSRGLGWLLASKRIDPEEWFFKAHFHQDPVCPGSLGIESLLQLLKYDAIRRWGHLVAGHCFEHSVNEPHTWQYRGQIVPRNRLVEVEADITMVIDEPIPELRANGLLKVDGLVIYQMKNFGIRIQKL
ncbi:MAG: beta-ketoacyl synthase N-terminal-like domain-containing protein [Desulfobacterales bacterium]|jgi:PfaB family protein